MPTTERTPIGERVATLEADLPALGRRQDETIEQLRELRSELKEFRGDMKSFGASLERQAGERRAVGWIGDGARTLLSALLAGLGLHFLNQHGS
jgi:hypothetical protein